MAARVSQVVVEAIIVRPTYTPTTITGAGVTQTVIEAVLLDAGRQVRVSQVVMEAIISANPDGSHGDPGGGGGGGDPATHAFGYAT